MNHDKEITELIALCTQEIEANHKDQTTMAWHDSQTPERLRAALLWYRDRLSVLLRHVNDEPEPNEKTIAAMEESRALMAHRDAFSLDRPAKETK